MAPSNFNRTILIAPLDWGLGHSTRCIPIVRYLTSIGCTVIIAAQGSQQKLLQLEFPYLKFVHLSGYNIHYSSKERLFAFKILLQLPKILLSIKNERKWLKKLIEEERIDAVISDNRYGLYNTKIPCVFITHQLCISTPKLAEKSIQKINYRLINKFSGCWIPDAAGNLNLAGKLSHPNLLPSLPIKYLGCLSRFEGLKAFSKKFDVLILISGPEPQRTILENKLIAELKAYKGKALLVRGLPDTNNTLNISNVTVRNHLTSVEMEEAFVSSDYIISRTGYTTLMDICKLKKKAILIPTPGQTEQEYLAGHLTKQKMCLTFNQSEFNLINALKIADTFPFKIPDFNMSGYKEVLDDFVRELPGSSNSYSDLG